MTIQKTPKEYSREIDVMKAVLVFGMVLFHSAILAESKTFDAIERLRWPIHLATFPGFLFCFGYVVEIAYLNSSSLQRWGRSIVRVMMAYYISAITGLILLSHSYNVSAIKDMLILSRLGKDSEFLLAYAVILVVSLVFRRVIIYVLDHRFVFLPVMLLLMASTFIPITGAQPTLVGLFIGIPKSISPTFPVFPYFPLYLMGMYFSRYKINPNPLIGLIGAFAFYLYIHYSGMPDRFPPSFAWIVGSMLYTLLWYSIARFLSRWDSLATFLSRIGQNTLFYFLTSNILLFAGLGATRKLQLGVAGTFLVGAIIFAIIYFLEYIVRRPVPSGSQTN